MATTSEAQKTVCVDDCQDCTCYGPCACSCCCNPGMTREGLERLADAVEYKLAETSVPEMRRALERIYQLAEAASAGYGDYADPDIARIARIAKEALK